MSTRLISVLLLLSFATLACNISWIGDEPTAAPPPILELPPATAATGSSPPIITTSDGTAPTVTPFTTATLDGPSLVALQDMNVRSGPGVQYNRVGTLLKDNTAPILGRAPDTTWWKIQCPPGSTGTECWISGGAQYTLASNAGGVAIAAVPPTPTPAPTATPAPTPTAAPPTAAFAYLERGDLWVAPLAISGSDIRLAGEPTELIDSNDGVQVWFSPDGAKILYRLQTDDRDELAVINRDGSGQRTLVRISDLAPLPEIVGNVNRFFDQVVWLNDNRTIAFNTAVTPREGPGLGSAEDLWTVDLDGTLVNRLPPGLGGGRFTLSPANQVVLTTPTELIRTNLDGTNREVLATFEFVLTYSEYTYYPTPQWTADGSRALVAIPSMDPLAPDAAFTLWEVPPSGPARQLGSLVTAPLFNDVVWSPNGSRLAYVRQTPGATNSPVQVVTADGAGFNQRDNGAPILGTAHVFSWNPTESHFLYVARSDSSAVHYLSPAGGSPMPLTLPTNERIITAEWVTPNSYLASVADEGLILYAGDTSGNVTQIFALQTDIPTFDVWSP